MGESDESEKGGNNDMQGFGNTPRGSKFFDETMPKIADELEILNKRIGEAMGIPKHLLDGKKPAPWPPPSGHVGFDDDAERLTKLTTMVEDERIMGAILAGLLLRHQKLDGGEPHDVMDIANGGGKFLNLTPEEIDDLCEDLNSVQEGPCLK
jgi:hypothetical protein